MLTSQSKSKGDRNKKLSIPFKKKLKTKDT